MMCGAAADVHLAEVLVDGNPCQQVLQSHRRVIHVYIPATVLLVCYR